MFRRSVVPSALLFGSCALGVASLGAQASSVAVRGTATVAITHVTVIDVAAGVGVPDRTVLVRGTRIVGVVPAARAPSLAAANVVDGRGRYLIPGLWDMHAHFGTDSLVRRSIFPLFVATGVTGVRDMWGDCDSACAPDQADVSAPAPVVRAWQRDVARGALVGPRLVAGSAIFEGPKPIAGGAYAIHSAKEAREKVRLAKRRGAAFIKVLPSLPRDAYLAVVDEARRQKLEVVGHVPATMSAFEASAAGQRSIEHMDDLLGRMAYATCASRPESPSEALNAIVARRDSGDASRAAARANYYRVLAEGYDETRCDTLFSLFRRHGTWRVPTLIVERTMTLLQLGDTAVAGDPRLASMPAALRDEWREFAKSSARKYSEGERTAFTGFLNQDLRIVGEMHRLGVPLLAGTDEPVPFVFPGFALHDELQLLVQAGLTPAEALRTATLNPARYLGATDSLGTVAAGKIADLVLLDADPLLDIHNTTRIRAVVANGRLLDRAALDSLLDAARRGAPMN
jgi:hypothetical protein